ncbi:unnamed protein product [Bursaphelenchus xylophilus]|uniref:(pine wood nematode) hypothetical protein n=1 Tax=Bursaphelenchus xylophilus TaxID=6326 RepID=A0A7I8XIA6_BURXY|nr:unnamed protein product [Bursaphelenchus xylophilus]CAG9085412.1 unnamed protein product [Bursaphelenchus xylophilus]
MVFFTYGSEGNPNFQKFSFFKLHVGVLMVGVLAFELLWVFSSAKILLVCYNFGANNGIEAFSSRSYLTLIPILLHLVTIWLGGYGWWICNGFWVFPLLISSFGIAISGVTSLYYAFSVPIAFLLYEQPMFFISVLPLRIVSVIIIFYFLMFARWMVDDLGHEQEFIENDVMFQMNRLQKKHNFLSQKCMANYLNNVLK